jgi:hypothetical protein
MKVPPSACSELEDGGTFLRERNGGTGAIKDAYLNVRPRVCSDHVDGGTVIRERDGDADVGKVASVDATAASRPGASQRTKPRPCSFSSASGGVTPPDARPARPEAPCGHLRPCPNLQEGGGRRPGARQARPHSPGPASDVESGFPSRLRPGPVFPRRLPAPKGDSRGQTCRMTGVKTPVLDIFKERSVAACPRIRSSGRPGWLFRT